MKMIFEGDVNQISIGRDRKPRAMVSFKQEAGQIFSENFFIHLSPEQALQVAPGDKVTVTIDIEQAPPALAVVR